MTVPSGSGSRPIGADPTAALPTSAVPPRDVPPPHATPPLAPLAVPAVAPAPTPAAPATTRDRDARDGGERRRKPPLAWLPWALLAALLTLLALMLLAGTLAGAERATGGAAGSGSAGSADGGSGGGSSDGAAGSLRVGETDLLSGPQALAGVADLQGQQAVGRGMRVQAVVADEGFWVGSSAEQRLFVYLTPEARASAGESGFQVRAGQTVDVNGRIIGTSPGDPELFGVSEAEGARQLLEQGAYLRATQVRLSP